LCSIRLKTVMAAGPAVLFENARLRVLDVRVAPGCVERMEHHHHCCVRWEVLDASLQSPSPTFHPQGTASIVDNTTGAAERRDLVFEVLLASPRHTNEGVVRLMAAAAPYGTDPGQVLKLENDHVRMWDFRSSLGMDRNTFHQHVLDNAWVVIGDGSSLNVYVPGHIDADGALAAERVKTVAFSDGFVSWTAVDNGGFDADGKTRLAPLFLHSVDNAGEAEFREYLIELK